MDTTTKYATQSAPQVPPTTSGQQLHDSKIESRSGDAQIPDGQILANAFHQGFSGLESPRASATLFISTKPKQITKSFSLDPTGQDIVVKVGGEMVEGGGSVLKIGDLEDFANILASLDASCALCYGVPKRGNDKPIRVLTENAWQKAGRPEGIICRTKEFMEWPEGAGVFMLDYDPDDDQAPLDREALLSAIHAACPGLQEAGYLHTYSSSSLIYNSLSDTQVTGVRGQRIYFLVTKAADIPEAGDRLIRRLWLKGHGYIKISKAGQLLQRTMLDGCVWQPNRLDFAAGAHCTPPLEQRRGKPYVHEGPLVDLAKAIPALTSKEESTLQESIAKALEETRPRAELIRTAYLQKRAVEIAGPDADQRAIDRARSQIERALDGGDLSGVLHIHVKRNGSVQPVTVDQILEQPSEYHLVDCRDPIDPEYDNARLVGKLYTLQDQPTLHSFAHGGATYRLHRSDVQVDAPDWPDLSAAMQFDELPSFPKDAIPQALWQMIIQIAITVKIPPDMAILTVLTVAGLACGRDVFWEVRPGLRGRANLYSLIFAARGERKTSAYKVAMEPVYSWIKAKQMEWAVHVKERHRRVEMTKRLESALTDPKTTPEKRTDYQARLSSLEQEGELDTLRNPNILLEDVTNEQAIRHMKDTGGTIGIMSDDARFFMQILTGIYSRGESRESLFIKSFEGDTPINDSRVGGGNVYVERPFAAMLLMIQTDWLHKLAQFPQLRDSGFFTRCLFCVPDSLVGARDSDGQLVRRYIEHNITEEVNRKYTNLIHRLLDASYERAKCVIMPLDQDAKDAWIEYHDAVEGDLGVSGLYADCADYALRYPNLALRLALIFALCENSISIRHEDVVNGIAVVDYFAHHAARAQQVISHHILPPDADRILRHIVKYRLQQISQRDAQNKTGIKSSEQALLALYALETKGFVRKKEPVKGRKGLDFDVNPQIYKVQFNEN